MSREPVYGTCHICGTHDKLSFEHVPPKAAFNDQPVVHIGFDDAIKMGPYDRPRGPISQRGAGAYTLCESCNNYTGINYAPAFADWCGQGLRVLQRTGFNPRIFTIQYIFPLRIIKQIASMFFSVNGPEMATVNPELVDFVLNREKVYLPPKYQFYTYFHRGSPTDKLRFTGFMAKANFDTGRVLTLSEISFPPFGYVFAIDSEIPDRRLFDISHFSRYRYNEFKVQAMRPVVLDTASFVPGDYRTPQEMIVMKPER